MSHLERTPSRLIYCKDVAIKLGIKGHACKRKYFLDKKNRQRHKLRSFFLTVPEDRQYLHGIFALNPMIARSTQTPIDQQIDQVMGGVKFEICDNLRHRINAMMDPVAKQGDKIPTTTTHTTTSVVTLDENESHSSISASTNYIIVNEDHSPSHYKKQRKISTEDCSSTTTTRMCTNNGHDIMRQHCSKKSVLVNLINNV